MSESGLVYALAGLLHDIGKFAQRADESIEQSDYLTQQTRNLSGTICRTSQQGFPTHQHVLWTSQFIENHRAIFTKAGLWGNDGPISMINLSSSHHKPSNFEQALITLADYWSSGLDRNNDRYLERNPEYGKDKFRSTPLISSFCKLRTERMNSGMKEHYGYHVQRFGTGESIFPVKATNLDNKKLYGDLWKEFENEFRKIPCGNPVEFIFSLVHLLKLYTWYIPASTIDYPDSSLFEHLKTTGAFSHCFAAYLNENPDAFKVDGSGRVSVTEGHHPVMLFCGDISGIQSFIYNISNKSAMKGLKGRSFYVQLLTETIASEITSRAEVTVMNQVYAAGGKFYLLLPNTKSVLDAIETYSKELEKELWEEHRGRLSVNFSSIPFTMEASKQGGPLLIRIEGEPAPLPVGRLWSMLARQTSEKKRRRFKDLIHQHYNDFFKPSGNGGEVTLCAVSGDELTSDGRVLIDTSDIEEHEGAMDGIYVSKSVAKQIEIGKSLYNAKYLIELKGPNRRGFKVGVETTWNIERDWRPHTVERWISLRSSDGRISLITEGFKAHEDAGLGFRNYGGISVAEDNIALRPLTLEELCQRDYDLSPEQSSNTEKSSDKLGVLRMDVDNLGNLFMHGLDGQVPGQGASFSSLATLSSLFDQFFGGYLNTIREKDEFKSHVNIVYAGGDDMFAVGRWDKLMNFAIQIRSAFRKYVCDREDISLSGGIAIIRPKFPIAKAAQISGDAEDIAKTSELLIEGKLHVKNAMTIFDIAINWEIEMPFVVECKNDLIHWIHHRKIISKGLLMKMFNYYEAYIQGDISWKWQSAYTLARIVGSNDKDSSNEVSNVVDILRKLLITNEYKEHRPIRFEAFIAACRWAELEIRNLKK